VDHLLLRVLWTSGARISEVLALRPADLQRDNLVLPNRKNPNLPIKPVLLPGAELGLTGESLLRAKKQGVPTTNPCSCHASATSMVHLARAAARPGLAIVKEASERANVRVLVLRASKHGLAGEAAPVNPHLFRRARVREIVRSTRNLALAQRQAGWSRLQMACLTISDDEARKLMRELPN
jgi:integrase